MTEVRVRFAPSPTGPLHIGGVRTALYNYLFARKNKGTMILRIEDTDQTRFVKGAESYIIDALAWCGIEFDEGVHVGGKFAPYRQSDRKEMYRKYADELISNGFAYYAFDTPEELDTFRKDFESQKKTFTYDSSIRMNLNNSLKLGEEESQKLISSGIPYVIRFKMPENEIIQMDDLIRGHIQVNTNTLDDKVLFKSDGMPTYHLANVVDDHLMEISHVIRGEEWLPSMPLHIMLYRAFGWQDTKPAFAHLPLLLKPEGNGKLSKRDGDRLGFPVFPTEWNNQETGEKSSGYREEGYIPEAFINMMALLGWNPGTEQEIFSMNELIENFSLERVNKSGARFDPEKAKWFNHQYILKSDDGVLAADFVKVVKNKGFDLDYEKARHMIGLVKERVHFAKELWSQTSFFFIAPDKYDETALKKRWKTESPELILKLKEKLENNPDFSASSTEQYIKTWIENEGLNLGAIMNAFRICLVGELKGPHLFDIVEMIGKEETLKRISIALETIKL